mmetsp:Transcript_122976/g.229766  ORF Transcript_122976/g.229766 Transcript_122976/m.229766 type:complete len:255 (+) Transcript_122976:69-833(+)
MFTNVQIAPCLFQVWWHQLLHTLEATGAISIGGIGSILCYRACILFQFLFLETCAIAGSIGISSIFYCCYWACILFLFLDLFKLFHHRLKVAPWLVLEILGSHQHPYLLSVSCLLRFNNTLCHVEAELLFKIWLRPLRIHVLIQLRCVLFQVWVFHHRLYVCIHTIIYLLCEVLSPFLEFQVCHHLLYRCQVIIECCILWVGHVAIACVFLLYIIFSNISQLRFLHTVRWLECSCICECLKKYGNSLGWIVLFR